MTGTYPPLKTEGRMPKTLLRLAARHPDKIGEMLNEKAIVTLTGLEDNGYFIYLRDGWWNSLHWCHTIQEDTVQECLKVFAFVVPCDSEDAYCDDGCMERIAAGRDDVSRYVEQHSSRDKG
jgi:hypothetical protein